MRLTLRTLLAYLDRILDEGDSQQLEQKIQESDIATQLVQRIQKSLKHRRSKAPDVLAQGLGNDANSVSEYLDNTLPAEQVPDFERVCLDSDDHLSEVAACHQILTLVLGEPAEAPVDLKRRIYRLRDSAEAAATTPSPIPTRIVTGDARFRIDPALAAHKAATPTIDEDERWTEAPDYLKRPQKRRWLPVALVSLIAFGIAMAGLRGMGPLDRSHPLAKRLGLVAATPDPAPAESAPADALPNLDTDDQLVDDRSSDDVLTPPADLLADDAEPLDLNAEMVLDATGESLPLVGDESDDQSADFAANSLDDLATGTDVNLQGDDLQGDGLQAESFDGDFESQGGDLEPNALAVDEGNGLPPLDDATDASLDNGFANEPDDLEPLDAGALAVESFDDANDAAIGTNTDLQPAFDAGDTSQDLADASIAGDGDEAFSLDAAGGDLADNQPIDPVEPPLPPTLINPLATNNTNRGNGPLETVPALPSSAADNEAAASNADADATVEPAVVEPEPPPVITDVGRFLNERQVLVTYDEASGQWQRVASGSRLQAGKLLMSLPTFRVPLSLASGLQVTLIGATHAELLPITDVEETPVMRLDYGRLRVATFSQAGTSFALRWGDNQSATIRLTDMETTFAVDLQPQHLPGAVATGRSPYHVLHVYLTSGEAEWTTPESTSPIQLTSGKRLSLVDDGPAQLSDIDEAPGWITGSDAKPRDPIAARDLAKSMTTDRPVTLVLREQADLKGARRLDVSSLAACSLAQFNEFDPLLVALNDSEFRAYWGSQYEVLRMAATRSDEAATTLLASLEKLHDAPLAKRMFDLLHGFSPQQLADGGAEQLVRLLDHDSSDVRVIASELLKSITGLPSVYRAQQSQRQRRAAIARWRKHLQNGEIVYAEVPEIVQLLNSSSDKAGE